MALIQQVAKRVSQVPLIQARDCVRPPFPGNCGSPSSEPGLSGIQQIFLTRQRKLLHTRYLRLVQEYIFLAATHVTQHGLDTYVLRCILRGQTLIYHKFEAIQPT